MTWPFKQRGRGKRPERGVMNKWEKEWAEHLELLKAAGEILWWSYECINIRLAKKAFYQPDFLVMDADGYLEVHEVKGHWEHDARLRIKLAAEKLPFRFLAITKMPKKAGGGWKSEEIGNQE